MTLQSKSFLAGFDIPKLQLTRVISFQHISHQSVVFMTTARNNSSSVRHEDDARDKLFMPPQDVETISGCRIPDPDGPVSTGRRNQATIGTEGHVQHVVLMSSERAQRLAGHDIPKPGLRLKANELCAGAVVMAGTQRAQLLLLPF